MTGRIRRTATLADETQRNASRQHEFGDTTMYKRRTMGAKRDPVKQWSLPDRVFFAAGACHMLAYAFLDCYRDSGFEPICCRSGFLVSAVLLFVFLRTRHRKIR
jgi:hypothetical protein